MSPAPRIDGLARHHLRDPDGNTIQTFHSDLNDLQRQILHLLDIPTTVYTPVSK